MTPESYLGSISEYAGTRPVRGWADCAGQKMSVAQNAALYSLLGTLYGGDGVHDFALPDLRPTDGEGRRVDWSQLGQPRKKICIEGLYPPFD